MENMKLPKINWLAINSLPPSRLTCIGIPVIGGTAL